MNIAHNYNRQIVEFQKHRIEALEKHVKMLEDKVEYLTIQLEKSKDDKIR